MSISKGAQPSSASITVNGSGFNPNYSTAWSLLDIRFTTLVLYDKLLLSKGLCLGSLTTSYLYKLRRATINQLYKNTTYQLFKYVLRPICIIIGIICPIILQKNGVFAVNGGTFFLFIPIGLFLCALGNILMVSCIKQFSIKSNAISIDYVNGFKTTNYNIKKLDIRMITGEYKLKKYFFIEPLIHHWSHTSNPAELFDFFLIIVLKNGTKIVLKHNVEQLKILDIFEPLTKVISNIQINTPANISKIIKKTNKLKSFSSEYNGVVWQFNGEYDEQKQNNLY